MDRHAVGVVADLERRGTFTERGYRNSVTALADLLGWDRSDARRRVIAAERVVAAARPIAGGRWRCRAAQDSCLPRDAVTEMGGPGPLRRRPEATIVLGGDGRGLWNSGNAYAAVGLMHQ